MSVVTATSITKPESDVFRHPLEFFFAEHDRHRIVSAVLERIADDLKASDVRQNAAYVLVHLEEDLPLHMMDEEHDLFPMLRERCLADDNIDEILSILHEEHEEDEILCASLLPQLVILVDGGMPENVDYFCTLARGFARSQRRHLGWENGTVLPLAEKRLTDEDQAALGRSMAKRRGVTFSLNSSSFRSPWGDK